MIPTFSFVCLGWVFFRAASVPDAFVVLYRFATDVWQAPAWSRLAAIAGVHQEALFAAALLVAVEWARRGHPHPLAFPAGASGPSSLRGRTQPVLRWALYTLIVLAICQYGPFRGREFIYFRF
jgi:hypothetical protein